MMSSYLISLQSFHQVIDEVIALNTGMFNMQNKKIFRPLVGNPNREANIFPGKWSTSNTLRDILSLFLYY